MSKTSVESQQHQTIPTLSVTSFLLTWGLPIQHLTGFHWSEGDEAATWTGCAKDSGGQTPSQMKFHHPLLYPAPP
jgi:hypothetical protein